MSGNFDVNFCKFHHEKFLGAFLDDLFQGTNSNAPLIKFKNKDAGNMDRKEMILFLFPNELVDPNKKEQAFRDFTSKTNSANAIGSDINKLFQDDPEKVIELFENKCVSLFNNPNLLINRESLKVFLKDIKDFIIEMTPDLDEDLKEINKIYSRFLKEESFEKILSRVLLCLTIGLKPENYTGKRIYTLEKKELKWIWIPVECSNADIAKEDITVDNIVIFYNRAKRLYAHTDYETSYKLLDTLETSTKLEGNSNNNQKIILKIKCLLAYFLLTERGTEQNKPRALRLLSESRTLPEAQYLLAHYHFGYYSNKKNLKTGYKHLEKAQKKKHIGASIELAEAYIFSYPYFKEEKKLTEEQCLEKANVILSQTLTQPNISALEKSNCLYLQGKICEKAGRIQESITLFKDAAILGHEQARMHLEKKRRITREIIPCFDNSSTHNFCIINGDGIATNTLIQTLPQNWSIYSCNSKADIARKQHIESCSSIHECLDRITQIIFDDFKKLKHKVIIAFLSDDETQNLNDGLELLDQLYNKALDFLEEGSPEKKDLLIKTFEIFIKSEYDFATLALDASINDMGENIYFKVHICDSDRDASHKLLHEAPLFIPSLKNSKFIQTPDNFSNVVIFGDTSLAESIAREIVAVGYMGENHPVTVQIVGDNTKKLRNSFYSKMPGLYACHQNRTAITRCILPEFIDCELNSPDFYKYFNQIFDKNTENKLSKSLSTANYFIVDIGSDSENIQFAINLRRILLKSTPNFDKVPFIAVHCHDLKTAYLANRLTLGNQKQGEYWHNRYDLYCFGMADTLYSYDALIENNTLEQQAEYIHKSYVKDDEQKVLCTYYSFQYNRDSSKITAIGLRYRLFIANCYEKTDEIATFSIAKDKELASKYHKWLEKNIESAAIIEQSRWNGFMLSRGWEPATCKQLETYIKLNTDKQHKQLLAKLHPFICEYEHLCDEKNGSMSSEQQKMRNFFEQEKIKVSDPRQTTLESVRSTKKMLTEFEPNTCM